MAGANGATLAVGAAPKKYPTVAELAAQVPDLPRRRGTGAIFFNAGQGGKLPLLEKMPEKPTLVDLFNLRFQRTRNHVMQSAPL